LARIRSCIQDAGRRVRRSPGRVILRRQDAGDSGTTESPRSTQGERGGTGSSTYRARRRLCSSRRRMEPRSYATRDLAAALFRWRPIQVSRCLYVVDRGQSLHFRQLFACLKLLGFEWADRCLHVPFGLIRFGGKKTSTRQGNVVLLESVFQEAISRVKEIIAQTRPDLTEDQLATTARSVGVAAVIFANVLPQRDKDVEFDWDKAVSLSGDSGPYLQYTAARYATILRRAPKQRRGDPQRVEVNYNLLSHEAEWTVARRLLDFGDYVERATVNCEPHIVAHYLLELAVTSHTGTRSATRTRPFVCYVTTRILESLDYGSFAR
jgi:arginyl-tRNA synthetase